jgi:hypothetical protein
MAIFDPAIAPYTQLSLPGMEGTLLCQVYRCDRAAAWTIHYRFRTQGRVIQMSKRYCDRHGQRFMTNFRPRSIAP